jgi:hypothetical protein
MNDPNCQVVVRWLLAGFGGVSHVVRYTVIVKGFSKVVRLLSGFQDCSVFLIPALPIIPMIPTVLVISNVPVIPSVCIAYVVSLIPTLSIIPTVLMLSNVDSRGRRAQAVPRVPKLPISPTVSMIPKVLITPISISPFPLFHDSNVSHNSHGSLVIPKVLMISTDPIISSVRKDCLVSLIPALPWFPRFPSFTRFS